METHTLALAQDRIVEEEQDDQGDEIPEIETLVQLGGITMVHLTMKRKGESVSGSSPVVIAASSISYLAVPDGSPPPFSLILPHKMCVATQHSELFF
jgi:hypothetical protein